MAEHDLAAAVKNEAAKAQQILRELSAANIELGADEKETVIEGETDFNETVGRAVTLVLHLEALSDANKRMEAALKQRREAIDNAAEKLRLVLGRSMVDLEKPKIILPQATVSARAGKDKVVLDNIEQLPGKYKTVEFVSRDVILKDQLLTDLQKPSTGPEDYIAGAHIENKPVLTIRQK